ncbi:MAG: Coenzyme F420 hydrogenase/dehydrogenase, beta subunit C-terminal domain [Dehalobacterium sp.]
MIPDDEGFLYPSINQASCIDCGLCRKICAFQNGYDTSEKLTTPDVYAVKHKEETIRMSSTSGGAFTAISDYVLENDGVVYGVSFDEKLNVVHRIARTQEERNRFRGSKYVQSDLNNIYVGIKNFLQDGKKVLFTGTPCQTAGLKSYLAGVNTEALILCDIVCHGTPSPLMWRENLNLIKNKRGREVIGYQFRDKLVGWRGANVTVQFEDKSITNSCLVKTFTNLYFSHNISRECCNICKYTDLNRPSDITIADFWGIEKCIPDFDDNKGISLVLINTLKGQSLFNAIKESFIYVKSSTKDCLQPQLQYPAPNSEQRNQFWSDYYSKGYEYVIKKYAGYDTRSRAKHFLRMMLRKAKLH